MHGVEALLIQLFHLSTFFYQNSNHCRLVAHRCQMQSSVGIVVCKIHVATDAKQKPRCVYIAFFL